MPPASTENRFGVIGGDTAGYPNGRRLGDDVVDIELQVVAGFLKGNKVPLGDGVDRNDKPFLSDVPVPGRPDQRFRLRAVDPRASPVTLREQAPAPLAVFGAVLVAMVGAEPWRRPRRRRRRRPRTGGRDYAALGDAYLSRARETGDPASTRAPSARSTLALRRHPRGVAG